MDGLPPCRRKRRIPVSSHSRSPTAPSTSCGPTTVDCRWVVCSPATGRTRQLRTTRTSSRRRSTATCHVRGYLFGGSGGAYQTMAAMENTEGVWDGGIQIVHGNTNSIPSNMTVGKLGVTRAGRFAAGRRRHDGPGGSGDPYTGLGDEQRTVLQEATKQGFPLRGWWITHRSPAVPSPRWRVASRPSTAATSTTSGRCRATRAAIRPSPRLGCSTTRRCRASTAPR